MRRALILITIISTLLLLGLNGLRRVGVDESALQQIYGILQLFWMEGDWTKEMAVIPWEVQTVRFLAPLTSFAVVVFVLAQDAWLTVLNAQVRLFSDHIVVLGINDMAWPLIRNAVRNNRKLVALEQDPDNRLIAECRKLGVRVVVGDWLNVKNLRRAGIERAAHAVALVDSDSTNVELMLVTRRLLANNPTLTRDPLRFHLHLNDKRLAAELEAYPKFFEHYDRLEVNLFNLDEKTARSLFLHHPFELYADALRLPRVHIVLFGCKDPAEQLILKVARSGHYATLQLPKVSVFADEPEQSKRDLAAGNPGLQNAVELEFHDLSPGGTVYFELDDTPLLESASAYAVCMKDDQESLTIALALRRALKLRRGANAPIFVRMQSSEGLAQLLEGGNADTEVPDGILPFGMLDEVLDVDSVIDDEQDTLARALHAAYRSQLHADYSNIQEKARRPRQEADKPWNLLAEGYRNGTRLQADHLSIKLRAVGYTRVEGSNGETFDEQEIETLARVEKRRYRAERYSNGWRPGARRNNLAKIDVAAFDVDDLSYDRKTIAEIPRVLAKHLNQSLSRQVFIGVTGHRLHKLDVDDTALRQACAETLREVASGYPGASFVVMSALAEGADRLIAEIAMDVLNAELWAPLPLPYELYVRDFDPDNGSVEEFGRFVAEARYYFEMPLVFGELADLEDAAGGTNEARSRQYALAGAYIVQRCDELIAVWDGEPAAGDGGTGDVVRWRQDGVPAEFEFPSTYFRSLEQKPPFVIPPAPDAAFEPHRMVPSARARPAADVSEND